MCSSTYPAIVASTLPEDMWSLILQHVPVADRLKHCALVCKKLSRATAAATDALNVSLRRRSLRAMLRQQQLAEAFASYLQHHGSHVTSLVLDHANQALTQLPCPRLLHLEISSAGAVQLGPHAGLPGVPDSATGLTCLKLSDCAITPDGSLSSLSVLVDLQHLQMQSVRRVGGGYATLLGSVLPSLKHLTCLDVSFLAGVEDVHHVSGLTKLSVLSIQGFYGSQPVRLTPAIAPGFVLPASLQQLCLCRGFELDPAVLAAVSQLTCVELTDLVVEGPAGGVSSGAALLAAVAGLQQLHSLVLSRVRGVNWPATSAAYAALTASSKLQKLVVRVCGLPEGVWEHAFPPAHRRPAMRQFATEERDAGVVVDYWGAAAAFSLVRCCPGLQDLDLSLSGAPAVAALRPLTELTRLDVWVDLPEQPVDLPDVRTCAQHVAALTSLQRLYLKLSIENFIDEDADEFDYCEIGFPELLPLAGLQQLTECDVKLNGVYSMFYAVHQPGPGQRPGVWGILLEKCLVGSNCEPAVAAATKRLVQQLTEQQHTLQIAALQQRNAQQEQQHASALAQQEQRVAQLEAQVQHLMQLLPQPEQH